MQEKDMVDKAVIDAESAQAPTADGDYIVTFTGKPFYFNTPEKSEIDIEDIAHALSNNSRFCGHTVKRYSVAEHSILVEELVSRITDEPITRLMALLHDASEAYLSDMATPIKRKIDLYGELEDRIQNEIYWRFGIKVSDILVDKDIVKAADNLAFINEVQQLMGNNPLFKLQDIELPDTKKVTIRCLSEKHCKQLFINKYNYLKHLLNNI